jgi:uncharacterized membrane protein YadS
VSRRSQAAGGEKVQLIPVFALAFAALVLVNSTGILPATVTDPLNELSRGCLVTAVAAIGLSTSLREVAKVGYRPVVMATTATLVLLCFALLAVSYAG